MEYTVKLEGLELFLYLKDRFKYTSSEAIEVMVKNNQDISFFSRIIESLVKNKLDISFLDKLPL